MWMQPKAEFVGEMSSVPASARLMGSGTVPCPRKRSSVAG